MRGYQLAWSAQEPLLAERTQQTSPSDRVHFQREVRRVTACCCRGLHVSGCLPSRIRLDSWKPARDLPLRPRRHSPGDLWQRIIPGLVFSEDQHAGKEFVRHLFCVADRALVAAISNLSVREAPG